MRKTLVKAHAIAHDVREAGPDHALMAGAYGGAGYIGHGSELLLCMAYLCLFVLHIHLVIAARRRARHTLEVTASTSAPEVQPESTPLASHTPDVFYPYQELRP